MNLFNRKGAREKDEDFARDNFVKSFASVFNFVDEKQEESESDIKELSDRRELFLKYRDQPIINLIMDIYARDSKAIENKEPRIGITDNEVELVGAFLEKCINCNGEIGHKGRILEPDLGSYGFESLMTKMWENPKGKVMLRGYAETLVRFLENELKAWDIRDISWAELARDQKAITPHHDRIVEYRSLLEDICIGVSHSGENSEKLEKLNVNFYSLIENSENRDKENPRAVLEILKQL